MYIKPPRSEDCVWHYGPPPHVGWWPASFSKRTDRLRWWNGRNWSEWVSSEDNQLAAGYFGCRESFANTDEIQWTHPWW